MDGQTKKAVQQRLTSAAGHLQDIERMIGEDACCIDTIRQIQAVQAALQKVNTLLLARHLHTCMSEAVNGAEPLERESLFQEVTNVFSMSGKL